MRASRVKRSWPAGQPESASSSGCGSRARLVAGRARSSRAAIVETSHDRPEAEDNQCVRRLVAATMFVLFASLNAIDGICCPDGCTREQASTSQHHDRESSDGKCVLCLGGVESAAPHTPSASVTVMNRFDGLPLSLHLDAPADPPDHPPRS
jgi:hypothetical protein